MTREDAEWVCVQTMGTQFMDDIQTEGQEHTDRVVGTYGSDFLGAISYESFDRGYFDKNYGLYPGFVINEVVHPIDDSDY